MSDYVQDIDFSTKDGLTTGDVAKIAKGADIDNELTLISTAIASKVDESREGVANGIATLGATALIPVAQLPAATESAIGAVELATTAEVVTGTDTTRAVTAAGVEAWGAQNAGVVQDLSNLTDPGADRIPFWDESAPDAVVWSTPTKGISITGTELKMTDVTADVAQPVNVVDGTFTFSLSGITEITGPGISQSADKFLISDAGTIKVMPYDEAGLVVQVAQTTQDLALTDINTIMEFDGTATLTIPTNNAFAVAGSAVLIVVDHATQVVTVTAGTGVTLNSVFHPGGGVAASDGVKAGGTALLLKTATDEWYLSGDIQT